MSIANGQVASATDVLISLTSGGSLRLGSKSATIASGVLTLSLPGNEWDVSPESGSIDDIDTITMSGVESGHILILRPASSQQELAIKHGTGNILTPYGRDVPLRSELPSGASATGDFALLMFMLTKWRVIARTAMTPEQNLFNFQNFR